MNTIFMNSKNSKASDPHGLLLNFTDKINLKVVSATFLLVCFLRLKDSTCETRKNVF